MSRIHKLNTWMGTLLVSNPKVLKAIQQYGRQEFNRALDLAEKVKILCKPENLDTTGLQVVSYTTVSPTIEFTIDKSSILNLKIE